MPGSKDDACRAPAAQTLSRLAAGAAMALAVALAVPSASEAASCRAPSKVDAQVQRVASIVNAERSRRGLGPVRISGSLRSVAQGHACDNAAREAYSHYGSDGSDLRKRLRRGGYAFRVAVENTARGFDTAERLVAFWMKSAGHRMNLLNPNVREIGIGVAAGERPAWVLVMAAPR